MNPYNVLLKPVVSEKSTKVRDKAGVYTFIVHPDASKNEIKHAVQSIWSVKVDSVNTLVQRGKVKRRGQAVYKKSNYKKAIVYLSAGQSLPLFADQ